MEDLLRTLAAQLIAPDTRSRVPDSVAAIVAIILGGLLSVVAVVFLALGTFWGLEGVVGTAAAAALTGVAALVLMGTGGLVIWLAAEHRRRARAREAQARLSGDLASLGFEVGEVLGRRFQNVSLSTLIVPALVAAFMLWRENAAASSDADDGDEADDPENDRASAGPGTEDDLRGRSNGSGDGLDRDSDDRAF